MADVKRIFERLLQRVNEEGDAEIAKLIRPESVPEAQWKQQIALERKRAFRVTVTIDGSDGSSLFGDTPELFESPNLPHRIRQIFMTNITAYQGVANRRPTNKFELLLDFSKPPLLDAENFVSAPTPNASTLTIEGDNDPWVASVEEAVFGILRNRKTSRSPLHREFVYDLLLWLVVAPAGFYVAWKVTPIVSPLSDIHLFLGAAAYTYAFLLCVFLFRMFFSYAKWTFPTVELSNNPDPSNLHRVTLGAIIVGVVGSAVYDAFRFLFG